MIDGAGMLVASIGDRLDTVRARQVFVGVVTRAYVSTAPGAAPIVKVRVHGGDERPLAWCSRAVKADIVAGNVVGLEILIASDSGQWAGLEILIPCGKA